MKNKYHIVSIVVREGKNIARKISHTMRVSFETKHDASSFLSSFLI